MPDRPRRASGRPAERARIASRAPRGSCAWMASSRPATSSALPAASPRSSCAAHRSAVTARSSGLTAARDSEVLTGGDSTAGWRSRYPLPVRSSTRAGPVPGEDRQNPAVPATSPKRITLLRTVPLLMTRDPPFGAPNVDLAVLLATIPIGVICAGVRESGRLLAPGLVVIGVAVRRARSPGCLRGDPGSVHRLTRSRPDALGRAGPHQSVHVIVHRQAREARWPCRLGMGCWIAKPQSDTAGWTGQARCSGRGRRWLMRC